MKKNFKSAFAILTGILFFTLTTIPETLFSQEKQKDEIRAVCLHDYIFSSEKVEAIPEWLIV